MKNIKFNFSVILILFVLFSTNILSEDFSGSKKVSKGDKFDVSTTNGTIVVSVWAKDEVHVKASKIDVDDVKEFIFNQAGNTVSVKFKGQNSNDFHLEISVPSYMILDFSTGGGNVTIKDKINGSVEITTGGGNVTLNDIENTLSVSTGGGNVSTGTVSDKVDISTGGGEVKVASALKSLEISTGGGNITVGSIGGKAEISTGGGNISVGKVSGSIELSTGGGNINLDGTIGNVEANTGGGNITLKNISGSLEANTAGGNIYAELTPGSNSNSELNTASGDINLTIPANSKVHITATVYVGSHANDPDVEKIIKSDFEPTTVEKTSKNLIKKFLLNDGGSVIELNTASGKIKINKK